MNSIATVRQSHSLPFFSCSEFCAWVLGPVTPTVADLSSYVKTVLPALLVTRVVDFRQIWTLYKLTNYKPFRIWATRDNPVTLNYDLLT